MMPGEVARRREYINENFTREEIAAIREQVCEGCKGDGPRWWDAECRYFCDGFYDALRRYDVETYI